jgi:transposase-like protein
MKSRREELARRVQAAPRTSWGARRYGGELKREVTEYGRERQREGATIKEIAGELGLSTDSLRKWMRWATVLIEAGKLPFEHNRQRSSRAQETTKREARIGLECQQEGGEEKRKEVPPALSEGNLLLCIIEPSGVKLERGTKEQLCEWLRMNWEDSKD